MAQVPPPERPLRGVAVRRLLSNAGAPLRSRADSLPLEQQARLYDASQPCVAIDLFVSHSWQDNGFRKYLTLRRYLMRRVTLVSAVFSVLLIAAVRVAHPVRLPGSRDVVMPGASAATSLGVLEYVVYCLLTWTIRATAHRWWGASKLVFFDCCCIPQTDPEQKRQGILRLGSFLERSRHFVILWDDTYFDRLWCVYELAVFVHRQPSANVLVLPTRLSAFGWKTELALTPIIFTLILLYPHRSSLEGMARFVGGACLVGQVIMATVADGYLGARLELIERLRSFDTRNAECSVELDRQTLYRAIERMYPKGGIDEFNAIVRTVIKAKTLASLSAQDALIPYAHVVTATLPWFGWCAAIIACSASGRETGVGDAVSTLIVAVTSWANYFIINPLAVAVCVQLLRSRAFKAVGGRLGAACVGAAVMFTGVFACSIVPMCIAHGGMRRVFGPVLPADALSEALLELPPWTAPLVAVPATLPFALLCARLYLPSLRRGLPVASSHHHCD